MILLLTVRPEFALSKARQSYIGPASRQQLVKHLAQEAREQKSAALEKALKHGWQIKGKSGHNVYELMGVLDDRIIYKQTCNINSAITSAVDPTRNTAPYNLNGQGFTVGLWDGGDVRDSHQELAGRVSIEDFVGLDDHATHVAGTIGAAGIVANSLGMAPSVRIDSYDWNMDTSEMATRAASFPGENDKIYVSNHSYGTACGWENDFDYWDGHPGWYWLGHWGFREEENFGRYGENADVYDSVSYLAPYFLPFWAAGNDRNDDAPDEGTSFYYFHNGTWYSKNYNSTTDPYSDGYQGGYDTILPSSTAKNIVTVGAVNDAVRDGVRDISRASITAFSGWGPTDDGRIKPDIVCNGSNLYSTTASSDGSYASYSGTSMAAPSAAGAAILLAELHCELSGGDAMRASTLKGLILHTADDLGNSGPDYQFGWGLMNTHIAAEHIKTHFESPDPNQIIESLLNNSQPTEEFIFIWDGTSPIKATLCWTDPAADEVTGLDNPQRCLVNDLDLTITAPDGSTVYYPFVLDPSNPDAAATAGDNILDNVEQVYIPAPPEEGEYTITVSFKGTLAYGQQWYSLIISGQRPQHVGVDYFQWDWIEQVQSVNNPFEVAITAKDPNGKTVNDFQGWVDLSGWTGYDDCQKQIGSGEDEEEYPVSVYYKKRRTQVIYTHDQIGQPGKITSLALYISQVPGLIRNNWTIRMKHTQLNEYTTPLWETQNWVTVYESNEMPGDTGWQYYNFTIPFDYNGTDNLMVDFSFDNDDWDTVRGHVYKTSADSNRTVAYKTDDDVAPPTLWSGTEPGLFMYKWAPNIVLVIEGTKETVTIFPINAGDFQDGIWSGHIVVLNEAQAMFLSADDGFGHSGKSNRFDVLDLGPCEPTQPFPLDGAIDVPIDTVLSWTCPDENPNQIDYIVYFDSENPPEEFFSVDGNELWFDPVLRCSQIYYWQVVASNSYETASSPVWSFTTQSLKGDFDSNCIVDMYDFSIFADYWLQTDDFVNITPQEPNNIVDFLDFALFSENWLCELTE